MKLTLVTTTAASAFFITLPYNLVHHDSAEYAREDDEPFGERRPPPERFLFEEGLTLFFKGIGNRLLKDAFKGILHAAVTF